MKNNERWLKQKMKEEYKVIDIGLDPLRGPTNRGPFYQMEKRVLDDAGYPYIKVVP